MLASKQIHPKWFKCKQDVYCDTYNKQYNFTKIENKKQLKE